MSVETNGAEWKRYYSDTEAWPDGYWHEYEEITVDGLAFGEREGEDLSQVPDTAVMTISGGVVLSPTGAGGPSIEGHFRKWRKAQTTTSFVVEVQKDRLADLLAVIKANGGKAIA